MYKHNCSKGIQIGYIEYENHKIKITEKTNLFNYSNEKFTAVCMFGFVDDTNVYPSNFMNIMKHNNDNNDVHHSFLHISILFCSNLHNISVSSEDLLTVSAPSTISVTDFSLVFVILGSESNTSFVPCGCVALARHSVERLP